MVMFFNIDSNKSLTVDWLKKEWRRIALQNHPDKGGSETTFKLALVEYEGLLKKVRANFTAENDIPEAYSDWTEFLANVSPVVRNAVIKIRPVVERLGAELEVTGVWCWVSNTNATMSEELKGVGLKWASGKKRWFFNGQPWRGNRMGFQDIRDTFGSEKWNNKREEETTLALG